METDRIAAAFAAWLAAQDAWAQAERRLKDGQMSPQQRQEVAAPKAEADRLFAAATHELHTARART
jgi:hypothetical protein